MNFRELIETLSQRIGYHQIPVNAGVSGIRGLIDSSAVHYELITQIVTAIYTGNRCRHLKDPVTRDATFEALEPIRTVIARSPKTDVDVFALMEAVCSEVARAFQPRQAGSVTVVTGEIRNTQLLPFRTRLKASP